MSSATPSTEPTETDIPVDRLYRIRPDQFRRADEAGVFPTDEGVTLVNGLLRRGNGSLYPINLDQYHRLDWDLGILSTDDRVELLGGRLVAKMPTCPPHRRATRKVRVAVDRVLPAGWYSDEQKPITLPWNGSEPEPDLQVTRGDPDDYPDRHPGPGYVGMLVEVPDSSLAQDQRLKARLYAEESIPIYWIVNLVARHLEVYADPSGTTDSPGYRQRKDYGPDDEVPVVLDGREIGRVVVRDLLP